MSRHSDIVTHLNPIESFIVLILKRPEQRAHERRYCSPLLPPHNAHTYVHAHDNTQSHTRTNQQQHANTIVTHTHACGRTRMVSLPHLPRATHTRAQHAPVPISNWHLASKCDTLARAAPSHARITPVFTHTFVRVRVRHRRRNSQSVFRMLLLAHAEGSRRVPVLGIR